MPHLYTTLRRILFLCLLCIGFSSSPAYALIAIGNAEISGQVVDTNGMPVVGVQVRVAAPLPQLLTHKTTTSAGGFYSIRGITPEQKLQLHFEKPGYTPSQGSVSLKRKASSKSHSVLAKFEPATLNKMLLPSGVRQKLDPATGGSLAEQGFKVSFSANSLTGAADAPVDVVISPIDVSTAAVAAAPGDYSARTVDGQPVQLESFSMADFTLSQNGRKVNLKPGATAEIELLLPLNTPLQLGDETPMWHFDTRAGLWLEEGRGRVDVSSLNANRLAVFATVSHFSWWNSDQAINTTEVRGRVVDTAGQPLAYASLSSTGIDYAGQSSASTDGQGSYCIKLKSLSRSALIASITVANLRFESAALAVNAGQAGNSCAAGTALQVADIVLPTRLACVEGHILDEQGQPVAGARVFTSAGSFVASDAAGAFKLPAAESSLIKVGSEGYPVKQVTTADAGAACAVVELRPNSGNAGPACLTGVVYQCSPDSPLSGLNIEARQLSDNALLGTAVTAADGTYCIDGLPAQQTVLIDPNPAGYNNEAEEVNSGNGGGTCATQSCNAAPPMDIWCY